MKKETLPVFGVGPVYAFSCLLLTVFGLFLKKKGLLDNGNISGLELIGMVIGTVFILIGISVWVHAVIIQRIKDEINSGNLVTSGIYSIVRNPIYLAILCVFTGVIVSAHNFYLLLLPIVFYILLTILIKNTEEKWLLDKFGTDYIEYCKHVNRVIPWFRH